MFLPGSYRDYTANGRVSGVYPLRELIKRNRKGKGQRERELMKSIRSSVVTIGLIVLSLSLSPTFGKGGPMGKGPMGKGPMGKGPMGKGPMGKGPMGKGPMGKGKGLGFN